MCVVLVCRRNCLEGTERMKVDQEWVTVMVMVTVIVRVRVMGRGKAR